MEVAIWYVGGIVNGKQNKNYTAFALIKSKFIGDDNFRLKVNQDIELYNEQEDMTNFRIKVKEISAQMIDKEIDYALKIY